MPIEFSRQLNELMKEEEERSKNKSLHQHFVDKVDKLFRRQLKQHFTVLYNRIASKWQALEQKHQREWLEISDSVCAVTKQAFEPNRNYSLKEHIERLGLYEDGFEARASHYEELTSSKYFAHEKYNLDQAFKRQMERLQGDWGDYIIALENDYEDLRAEIMGPAYSGRAGNKDMSSTPRTRNAKHQHLTHTALVLRPTKRESLTIESHRIKTNISQKKDLNGLNIRFQNVCTDVKQQQLSAERMIRRQAIRMKIQLQYEIESRDKVEKHRKKENHTFEHLMDLIKIHLEKRALRKRQREEERRLKILEEMSRVQPGDSESDSSIYASDSSLDSITTSYRNQKRRKAFGKSVSMPEAELPSRESVLTRSTVASRQFRRSKSRGATRQERGWL